MTDKVNRPTARSLYWSNVQPELVEAQRRVFSHLELPLSQDLRDRMPHGDWMDETLANSEDDIVVFCDIDAVPLTASAYDRLARSAAEGRIAGLAQACNHLGRPDHIYAAPMFMALSRKTWTALGRPSMAKTKEYDPGQKLCLVAEANGVGIDLILPTSCLHTLWPLATKRLYGLGTFYGENEFFHLFQARKRRFQKVFLQVCEDICQDRAPDMAKYLLTARPKSRLPKPLRKYFINP